MNDRQTMTDQERIKELEALLRYKELSSIGWCDKYRLAVKERDELQSRLDVAIQSCWEEGE